MNKYFELKKDYQRGSKLLPAGTKIPTTKEGYEWFVENGYGDPKKEKKKVKKETKTKKDASDEKQEL